MFWGSEKAAVVLEGIANNDRQTLLLKGVDVPMAQ